MKKFIQYVVIGILLTGCEEEIPQQEHSISVLIDRTDVNGYKPTSEEVLRLVKPKIDADGLELSLLSISDIYYNPKHTFVLSKAVTGWLANEDKRRKKIKRFYKQFSDTLTVNNQKNYGYGHSEVYKTLITELNHLSEKEGIKKVLLFSDLQEHSFFSVYNKQHLRLLRNHPKKVLTLFKQAMPVDEVKDVELHILYQPTKADAELFSQMLSVYRNLLKPKGVKIKVGFHNRISL